MIRAIPSLQQRLIAVAILVVVVALCWLALVRPLAGIFVGGGEEMARLVELRGAYARAAAERPALEARLGALRKEEASLPGLLSGASSTVAAAALQSEIKKLIEANGGEIRSSQNLPSSSDGGFEKIAIRFDVAIATHSLENLIFQLKIHTPYLFIDQADIRSPDTGGADGQAVVDPRLSIRCEISAYRWAGAS